MGCKPEHTAIPGFVYGGRSHRLREGIATARGEIIALHMPDSFTGQDAS